MKDFPPLPPVADAHTDLLDRGHLWILELVDGEPLRFRLDDSGLVRFGDERRVYADADDVPARYRHAVRHVRENVDRDALRNAVADVERVVFFGAATHRRSVDYDWERLPSFLGYDVWSGDAGEFRPPDAAEAIFDRLGLHSANAVAKEVNTRDFDPDSYEIPRSAWYDGPAKSVVVKNKRGGRATLTDPSFRENAAVRPVTGSPADAVDELAPPDRFERVAADLEARGRPVTFDAVFDRAFEGVLREAYARLDHHESEVTVAELRSALAPRTRAFLDGREA